MDFTGTIDYKTLLEMYIAIEMEDNYASDREIENFKHNYCLYSNQIYKASKMPSQAISFSAFKQMVVDLNIFKLADILRFLQNDKLEDLQYDFLDKKSKFKNTEEKWNFIIEDVRGMDVTWREKWHKFIDHIGEIFSKKGLVGEYKDEEGRDYSYLNGLMKFKFAEWQIFQYELDAAVDVSSYGNFNGPAGN